MTDLSAIQQRLAARADVARSYWTVKTADREFLLHLSPPQRQEWVMAKYPGAGVLPGVKP